MAPMMIKWVSTSVRESNSGYLPYYCSDSSKKKKEKKNTACPYAMKATRRLRNHNNTMAACCCFYWPNRNLLSTGKLSMERTFTNFAVLEPPAKVFFTKVGGAIYPPMVDLAFRESFLHEMVTSYWSMKVFTLYSIYTIEFKIFEDVKKN